MTLCSDTSDSFIFTSLAILYASRFAKKHSKKDYKSDFLPKNTLQAQAKKSVKMHQITTIQIHWYKMSCYIPIF